MKTTKKIAEKKTGKSATLAKSSPRTPVKKTSRKARGGKGKGVEEPRGHRESGSRTEPEQNPIKRNPLDEVNEMVNEGQEINPDSNGLNTTEDEIGKRKLWL